MNYFVNVYKLIIAVLCCAVFGAAAVLLFLWNATWIALIFLLLCLIYGAVAVQNGSMIQVGSSGVSRRFPRLSMDWETIAEVGVVGLRVLKGEGKKFTGAKYIYFSNQPLSEEERFDLCLKWPPKDVLYFRFSPKRIAAVQRLWEKDVVMYNTGDLQF